MIIVMVNYIDNQKVFSTTTEDNYASPGDVPPEQCGVLAEIKW